MTTPPKCLHIVENLDRGAVETWLVRMLRHARQRGDQVDWTFYCALGRPGGRDAEARELGARVVYSPVPLGRKAAFVHALRRELERGYHVLHAHHDLVSAMYLAAAAGVPVARRIVHVHNADETVPTPNGMKQRLLREPMRRTCLMLADRVVANSRHSLETFLAGRRPRPERDGIVYYGIDPAPFGERFCRDAIRREIAVPADARIVLFAGRMVPEKNPLFAVDVVAEMHAADARVVGVFAGDGSLVAAARERVRARGLDEAVRFLGWRGDVPRLMRGADWFILPHPEERIEGFGMAVVEAQLAGLPLLLSFGVADDPLLPTAHFRRLPLATGPSAWAAAAVQLADEPAPSRIDALRALAESPMDMDRALDGLLTLHA